MLVNEYIESAAATAIYPDQGKNTVYPVLGLCGEAGEVCEQAKKMLRDDRGELTPERQGKFKKELGDVLWYVAAVATEIQHRFPSGPYTLSYVHTQAVAQSIKSDSLARSVRRLFDAANRVSQALDETLGHEKLPVLLERVLMLVADVAARVNLTLEEVAVGNLQKLSDRKQRGTLQGDGSER